MSVNWTAVSTVGEFLAVPNTNTNSWFWLGMLILIFLVVLIVTIMKSESTEEGIIVSGFVGLITGIFLVYMDLIAWQYVLAFVGLLVMIFIYIIWSSTRSDA